MLHAKYRRENYEFKIFYKTRKRLTPCTELRFTDIALFVILFFPLYDFLFPLFFIPFFCFVLFHRVYLYYITLYVLYL